MCTFSMQLLSFIYLQSFYLIERISAETEPALSVALHALNHVTDDSCLSTLAKDQLLKGTVSRDFLLQVFL